MTTAVPKDIMRLSTQIREEGGLREEILAAKCNWERKTRAAVLMEHGDPGTWAVYDIAKLRNSYRGDT